MSFPRIPTDPNERPRVLGAFALIAVGVLGLLSSLGVLGSLGGLFGLLLFGGAAVFAASQGRRTGNFFWRAAAYPLFGLAIASVAPASLGGAAFLGSLGLAFWLAWRDDEQRWWALIPAGTLLSLGLTSLVDGSLLGAGAAGSVFLFGLAATFFALTRLRVEPQGWAIFPAGALALLAVVSASTAGGWLFPLVFIAAGVYLLWRSGSLPGMAGPTSTPWVAPAPPAPPTPPAGPPAAPAAPSAAPSVEPSAEPSTEPSGANAVDLPAQRPDPKPTPTEAEIDAETRLQDDGGAQRPVDERERHP
ncbi:MAG: hypothetical protein ABR510_05215 [Trueperaceae bacterium]